MLDVIMHQHAPAPVADPFRDRTYRKIAKPFVTHRASPSPSHDQHHRTD
jgi:hypothetical protein